MKENAFGTSTADIFLLIIPIELVLFMFITPMFLFYDNSGGRYELTGYNTIKGEYYSGEKVTIEEETGFSDNVVIFNWVALLFPVILGGTAVVFVSASVSDVIKKKAFRLLFLLGIAGVIIFTVYVFAYLNLSALGKFFSLDGHEGYILPAVGCYISGALYILFCIIVGIRLSKIKASLSSQSEQAS